MLITPRMGIRKSAHGVSACGTWRTSEVSGACPLVNVKRIIGGSAEANITQRNMGRCPGSGVLAAP
jgi:hypothetical protein